MERTRSSPIRKPLLWALSILGVAMACSVWWAWAFGRPWLDRTIRERIETAVKQATVEGYHFEMDSLRAEFMSGDVHIHGIHLTYDSALKDSLRAGVYDYLFAAHAHTIALRGTSIWRAVVWREVRMHSIEVDTPAFHYTIGDRRVALEAPFGRLGQADAEALQLFHVHEVRVRGARARMADLSGHIPMLYAMGLDISANDLRVIRPGDKKRADLDVGAVDIRLDSMSTDIPGGYRLRFGETHLSDRLQRGSIHHITLERIDDLAPAHRTVRLSLDLDSLVFANLDVAGLIGDRALTVRAMVLHEPRLHAELDKDSPEGPARTVMLPPAALLALPFPIQVDSLRVANGSLVYRERSDRTGLWGTMRIADLDASFTGITNRTNNDGAPATLAGDIQCSFMDTAALQARYEARLDEGEEFTFAATLTNLPLSSLDSLTSNLLRLSLVNGRIELLDLVMKADAKKARGTMAMTYADVVTTVASNATHEQRRSMLGSVMDFVLAKELGGGLSDQQRRSVSVDRDPNRSLFTYIWHFTRAGIKRDLKPGATKRIRSLLKKDRNDGRKQRRARTQAGS